jgi:surface protein
MSINTNVSRNANTRNLVNQELAITPWVRNPLWMTMPDISATGTQRIVGLYRVDDSDNNFICFGAQAQGATPNGVTVDWGDGTVQSFVTNNTMTNIQYKYNYANIADSSTSNSGNASSLGYKQVIVSIIPSGSAGVELVGFAQDRKHNQSSLSTYQSKWLEFIVNGSGLVTLSLGGGSNVNIPPYLESAIILNKVSDSIGVGMSSLFRFCYSLKNVILPNTSLLTNTSFFDNCSSLEHAPFYDSSNATVGPFFNTCTSLKYVPPYDTRKVTAMNSMFQSCYLLKTVPFFDTSKVTNMSNMFGGCSSLESVPFFNTISCTGMNGMFSGASRLKQVPLFNTSGVTNMASIFFQAFSLQNIPSFDTSKNTTFQNFAYLATSITGAGPFNLASATRTDFMFGNCGLLKTIPILTNTSGVTNMSNMFQNCRNLEAVSGLDTRNVNNFTGMFTGCTKLRIVSGLNMSATSATTGYNATVGNTNNMFNGCVSLETINGSGLSASINLGGLSLSSGALNNIYTNLLSSGVSAGTTIVITGNWGASASNTGIALSKGWTVIP